MLALSLPARADDIKPKNFPGCTKGVLVTGIKVCGFTDVADWKKVLDADAELTATRDLLGLERAKNAELAGQVENYKGQVAAYERICAEQKSRNEALTKDLLDTNLRLEKERVKSKWGNPIAWTTAAVAAAVLGGYLLNDAF